MKLHSALLLLSIGTAAPAFAASLVNLDSEAHFITVTEGANRDQIAVGANQTLQFCRSGCFVTLPNGERAALAGTEIVEITEGGAVLIRLPN